VLYFLYSLKKGEVAGSESVGRVRARMGDPVAAADRELRGHPGITEPYEYTPHVVREATRV
jgi:hypothetical protein